MDDSINAVNIFDRFADLYQQKYMDVSLYHDSFDIFCEAIEVESASILELACGPGNVTKYLLSKRPDFTILGTDLSPNMIKLAQINNPKAKFKLMDARNPKALDQHFDGIMCAFCLPYLSKQEAVQLIKDWSEILNPAGVIYISTMEDDNIKSGLETSPSGNTIFMNYHEEGYLMDALLGNGFNIIDIQRKTYKGQNSKMVTDLLIVAQKIATSGK